MSAAVQKSVSHSPPCSVLYDPLFLPESLREKSFLHQMSEDPLFHVDCLSGFDGMAR